MSVVAQRSWAGRHRRGSRCVPLGRAPAGQIMRAGYPRPPLPQYLDHVARSAYECGDLWRVDPRVSTVRQYWRPWDNRVGRCRCLNLGEYLMDL